MQSLFTKEQFLQFQTAFKARAKAGQVDHADMLLYNIMRGKNTQNGFSPITNTIKLANGAQPWFRYESAKYCVISRVVTSKWSGKGYEKIWSYDYLKSVFGLDASEEQLKSIAQAAGWVLK